MTDPRYVLQNQVGHLLRRVHQRATQIFLETFEDSGLTPTQWAALAQLAELEGASQNHLGRMTAMDPATIQGVIQRLEKRGLIERRPDPGDRRRTVLSLSPAGETLAAQLRGQGATVSELTLAPLDEQERKQFVALLRKLS